MNNKSLHSSLTPNFSNFGISSNSCDEAMSVIDIMRHQMQTIWTQGFLDSAIILAEYIVTLDNCNSKDTISLAKLYFQSGQARRCLVVLEQQNLLSISEVEYILSYFDSNDEFCGIEKVIIENVSLKLYTFSIAGDCLFSLSKFEDCLSLLNPFLSINEENNKTKADFINSLKSHTLSLNPLAYVYYVVGKCYDQLENRNGCISMLSCVLEIDPVCIEAVTYLCSKSLITLKEKRELLKKINFNSCEHLSSLYRHILSGNSESSSSSSSSNNSFELIRQAEIHYIQQHPEEAYRLARKASNLDPYDDRGTLLYIASAVELNLRAELFYIGHELTLSFPKSALSWYAVGCYYYCCKKYELSQKYFLKSTKLDKRFINAWVALGHSLVNQGESEHAIASYRAAMRLAPGDYKPLLYMAMELNRTNNYAMAFHLLVNASENENSDPSVLNEVGIILMRLDRLDESIKFFDIATKVICSNANNSSKMRNFPEIFSNYAYVLRRSRNYEESIKFYKLSLSFDPQDPDTLAGLAIVYHLSKRFDTAIMYYHQTLALSPSNTLSRDMLQNALRDKEMYDHQE